MDQWEDYNFEVLGEPSILVAKVVHRLRTGVLVLTDTRIVLLRKKQSKTFIHREFSRDEITGLTFTVQIGGRQLSIAHDREWFYVVGARRELEPFVEPLQISVATNSARLESEECLYVAVEEKARAKQEESQIDAIVGEPILNVAAVSSGFGTGMLVLTETRLIYLRKKEDGMFVDRKFDRASITNVSYTETYGVWFLGFNEGFDTIAYDQTADDLRPFVEPLQASADANTACDFHHDRVTNAEVESTDGSEDDKSDAEEEPREGDELILNPWTQRIISWTVLGLIAFGIFFFATNSCKDSYEVNDPCLDSYAAQEACANRLGRQLDAFDRSKADGHSNNDAWATSEATR